MEWEKGQVLSLPDQTTGQKNVLERFSFAFLQLFAFRLIISFSCERKYEEELKHESDEGSFVYTVLLEFEKWWMKLKIVRKEFDRPPKGLDNLRGIRDGNLELRFLESFHQYFCNLRWIGNWSKCSLHLVYQLLELLREAIAIKKTFALLRFLHLVRKREISIFNPRLGLWRMGNIFIRCEKASPYYHHSLSSIQAIKLINNNAKIYSISLVVRWKMRCCNYFGDILRNLFY